MNSYLPAANAFATALPGRSLIKVKMEPEPGPPGEVSSYFADVDVKPELKAESDGNGEDLLLSLPRVTPPAKKRARKSASSSYVTQSSFGAIVGQSPHTLVLGTFPSEKSQLTREQFYEEVVSKKRKRKGVGASAVLTREELDDAKFQAAKYVFLRGGDGEMNYGNWKNPFWNIAGVALGFVREHTTYPEKVRE